MKLTELWYSYFCEAYRYGMANPTIYQNLRKHLEIDFTQLTSFYQLTNLYFGSTYINGDDDRAIKQKINQTIQNSQFCQTAGIQNRPNPRKIAIITAYWIPGHSAYRIFSGFIESLKEDYDLTLVHLGVPNDNLSTTHFKTIKYVNFIDGNLNLDSIRVNDFALVFYPDVGMNQESIILANLRLAPIQVCGLGHSVSTFGSQIDYFISGTDVEIAEDADSNYSEKLVLLPGYGANHQKPDYQIKNIKKRRSELIVNCPWYAHKINYPLIASLQKILNNARVNLLFRFYPGHAASEKNGILPLVADLGKLLGESNIEVILNQPYETYMEIMEEGDVCLDSYPFGGCNIIVDSLYLRKPIVTFEGKKWYNRIGSQMLREVGLTELIATNVEQYISLTLKLIHDEEYRQSISQKLERVNLDETIFRNESQLFFKQAIDSLIHERAIA
ncbi:MAG: hypothetical protein SW833_07830 [Cyanobacteriota bacterium]|nr:hypothetical protein [Cyanobacteriota bacterium]